MHAAGNPVARSYDIIALCSRAIHLACFLSGNDDIIIPVWARVLKVIITLTMVIDEV